MSDAASGRINALVLKLRHPLTRIRHRALHTLLFKLREHLIHYKELEPLHCTLVPALLACLEPPMGVETLHVLQLLVQNHSEAFLASLQHHGAAEKLQRAANANPELQTSFDQLLKQIYTTKLVEVDCKSKKQTGNPKENLQPKAEPKIVSKMLTNRRLAPKVDELEASGWRFAQVTLVSADDQYLFEFEVKLQLRTETRDIVAACAIFRNDILRNFPAELFLQRPLILQYLLHLLQQPLLPEMPRMINEESSDILMEKAMEISLGVNYFDELGSATYSSKRGHVCGAIVMASLKAIESFLYALRLSRRVSLDPTYVVHKSRALVESSDSYETLRVLYPRARVEVGEDVLSISERRTDSHLEQFSFSGAIYKLFVCILPLLRSARHPRLHLLNLLISALPDLPEQSRTDPTITSVQQLDKLRLERIFDIICGICRPFQASQLGHSVINSDLELTHSMTWKFVELVIRLLRLYSAHHFLVVDVKSESNEGRCSTKSDKIIVPRQLWESVKTWIANPVFSSLFAKKWDKDSIIQDFSQIDATIYAFVQLKQSSRQDAKQILDFVEFAKEHRETDFELKEKPDFLTIDVARKALQARTAFGESNVKAIADAALLTIRSVMTAEAGNDDRRPTDNDLENIQFILCDLLSGLGQMTTSTSNEAIVYYFFHGFSELTDSLYNENSQGLSDYRHQCFVKILAEPKFLTLLLLILATHNDANDQVNNAALWATFRTALHQLTGDKVALFEPVIPLIQHFAYIESSEMSSQDQHQTQSKLAEILIELESIVPDHTRYLSICRCLLHKSSYIRKAAASGILRILSRTCSTSADWISKHREVLQDPFGGPYSNDGENVNLEVTLMETPLPVSQTKAYTPNENELSAQLSKLSHLYKVISGTSSTLQGMRVAALKELVVVFENASAETFTLFEELARFSDLTKIIHASLRTEAGQINSPLVYQSLLLLRTLLFRSRMLRSAVQHTSDMVELYFLLIFHPLSSIRAQMYYIILLLTCSAENFIPHKAQMEYLKNDDGSEIINARIPDMLKSTFGLYSNRWARCFVVTLSLQQHLQATFKQLTTQSNVLWLQEIQSIVCQKSSGCCTDEMGLRGSDHLASALSAEYAFIARRLREAPSHGKCLNALYHLMMICKAWCVGREHFVNEWEADFERYVTKPPKSDRDEVILGSLVSTLSIVFSAMTREEQLRALVVVKRKFLPLLKISKSAIFPLQMARLLLNVSTSKVKDLFLSLAADTDIISTICTKYSAAYAIESVLHSLMLEVLLQFAQGVGENATSRLSKPSRDKICKRLVEMIAPLLTVVCRHRIPGSFMKRDVFIAASQCMIAILQTLPSASLTSSNSTLQHTDSSILLDGSWASRFLFDHVSPIRELGYRVIEQNAAINPPSLQLVEMAAEISTDKTESDAVRAAACSATMQNILQFHERTKEQQAALSTIFHGNTFAGKVVRILFSILKSNKLLVHTASAFLRLIRVTFVQNDTIASRFGDMQKELEKAQEDYDIYPLLIQALSVREWKLKCYRYCSSCMLLSHCDDIAWRHSLLPAILETINELLNLLQTICRRNEFDQVAFFLLHTTLQYQVMELVKEIYDLMDDIHLENKYYEVLDLSASTLSILAMQTFDQKNIRDFLSSTASDIGANFILTVAKLLEPQHPIKFRVSFCRAVAAVSLLIPGSYQAIDAAVIKSLCSNLFELYQELAQLRLADTKSASEAKDRASSLASIRRVACALQVLLESRQPSLRPLVHIKRGVPFAMTSIKELFTAIRIAGGLSGSRNRSSNDVSASSRDAYVLDLFSCIQTHMEILTSIIGGDEDNQQLVKDEGLLHVILTNWNMMKTAHMRGSELMIRTLYLLANYIYGNDKAKKSLLTFLTPGTGKGDTSTSLVSLLLDLANFRGEMTAFNTQGNFGKTIPSEADMALSNAACQVLKAALLNSDCMLNSVKTGSIPKLVSSLQDRLRYVRQTSKMNYIENENLGNMLSVLSSIACSEEGARYLYTSVGTVLSFVFDDVFHLSDQNIRHHGCLFVRNLSLSQAAKNHFAFWEELLDPMVDLCVRASGETPRDLICLDYISVALWSLVYDNQKARALLLSKPATLRSLKQVLSSQSSDDIGKNLQRVLMLVEA
ncbi:putative rotatin [Plasmopara halstedii]